MKKQIHLSLMAVFLSACHISSANISDVTMCEAPDEFECMEDIESFSPDTPEIFLTAFLGNAQDNIITTITWKYLEEEPAFEIDSVELANEDNPDSLNYSSSYSLMSYLVAPSEGWPLGEYEVILSLNTDNSDPIHKEFVVE